ncbi:DAPG hydrolase family protein [Morganella psychrotolerans]|uniref:DAPG hydrolase family protein n=1 Tax=Morganella psychrotolerans TaxID=368603 RepID=UPI0039B09567
MSVKKQNFPRALNDINELLSPEPLRMEMGLERSDDGLLTVSVRTDLHGCKGRMLAWWFTFFETTQHIRWWHPHDHVAHHGWDSVWKKGENYIGATIRAVESLGPIPPVGATLKFNDAADFFDAEKLAAARADNQFSAAICAHIGFGDDVKKDTPGYPIDGKMLHITYDTEFGCVLRSRFLLGASLKDPLTELPDEIGFGLMKHCYNEFTYLSRFLPSIYYGEHGNDEKAPLPWA